MKYGLFKTIAKANTAGYSQMDYKIPIICDSTLYNNMPTPEQGSRVLGSGPEEGYDRIKDLFKDVCDVVGFNPFTFAEFQINNAGLSSMVKDVIEGFNGVYTENNGDWDICYGGTATANRIFYLYLTAVVGARASYGTTPYGAAGTHIIFCNYQQPATFFSSNDGVECVFEVWPENAIDTGFIDFSNFYTITEGGFEYIRSCHIVINVWYRNNKYNWSVVLRTSAYNDGQTAKCRNLLQDAPIEHIYSPDNPYDNHQEDGTEGGKGGFDDDSDPVGIPDLPSLDIGALGGVNIYRVTAADVAAMFSYLNSNAPGDSILKWCTNPIQGIVSLHVLPYPVTVGAGSAITILGSPITGTAGYKVSQFQQWNLGSVYVDYGFGDNFLDYEPFSKCSIYLPFIGIRQLKMDEVVGHSVNVTYQFDNVSGACIAYVSIAGAVRYSFAGSCAIGIPINQQNWGQTYIAAATSAAGALAGGIGGAANALAQGAGKAGALVEGAAGALQGSGGLESIVSKPTISRSGSISGAASALGVAYPYIIIERPEKAKVANPAPVTGLMCGRTLSLGSLSGYNIIEHIHLHGIAATGEELEEIERLLYQGVVF